MGKFEIFSTLMAKNIVCFNFLKQTICYNMTKKSGHRSSLLKRIMFLNCCTFFRYDLHHLVGMHDTVNKILNANNLLRLHFMTSLYFWYVDRGYVGSNYGDSPWYVVRGE